MSESNRTPCPCCGAPTTIEHTPNSVEFKYAPDYSKMAGYDLRHLRIVAQLLKDYNITPADVRDLVLNLEGAMNIARAEYEKRHQRILEEALKQFQTPHIEPWPVTIPTDKEENK